MADDLAFDALWRRLQLLLRLPPDRLGYAAKATAYPRAPSAQRDYRDDRYPANPRFDVLHAQPPVPSDRLPGSWRTRWGRRTRHPSDPRWGCNWPGAFR